MSITTIYHTPHKGVEDSYMENGQCTKKQVCNVCEATFSMTRGCSLEKRCPACRFLGYGKIKGEIPNHRVARANMPVNEVVETALQRSYMESVVKVDIEEAWYEVDYDTAMDREHIIPIIAEVLTPRELQAVIGVIMYEASPKEMSFDLNVTSERVRQITQGAIKKLKHPRVSRVIDRYLHWC